ncbi:MAG TPA: hypothetical protein VGM56_08820 [Byssovorax sp.]|jgi:hypothetical protein
MRDAHDDNDARLPGDEVIADARKQITHGVTLPAPPELVWPRLLEMAARHEGTTATLGSDAPRALVLGSLFDHATGQYLPFDAPRPADFWQATWALVLTPLDAKHTRLDVRARVAFTSAAVQWAALWTHPFSDFTDGDELHRLRLDLERAVASTAP